LVRFLGVLVLLGWGFAAHAADPQLVEELRKGGYVLYIRHASTDFSKNDANMKSYEDCASQRNLTDKGRDEARALGAHIRRLGIPIGKVYASPFCRTVETAMLAFGRAEKTQEVRGGPATPDDPARYAPLRQLLGTAPAKGVNNVISSHGNPYRAVFGDPYLAEGEIAVVRPGGKAHFEAVARIKLGDWDTLAR
jgi:histidine phosphatase superfamily protein (branch 1)